MLWTHASYHMKALNISHQKLHTGLSHNNINNILQVLIVHDSACRIVGENSINIFVLSVITDKVHLL